MIKPPAWLDRFRSKRPAYTLFFVTSDVVVRVDGDVSGRLVGEPLTSIKACPTPEQLVECVAAALDGGNPPPGRKVWVLYEGLATYVLSLTTAQTLGLGDDLLEQALLFELEGVTGLATSNKSLAYLRLGEEDGMSQYWVCAAPADLFERLAQALKKRGGKLVGIAHPGGVPTSLTGTLGAWLRFEYCWPDILFGLYAPKDGPNQVQVFSGGLQSHKARNAAERWKSRLPQGLGYESLATGQRRDFELDDAVRVRLDEPDTLRLWLSSWLAAVAAEGSLPVPVIQPGVRPELEYFYAGGIAAVALLVCLAHFGWHRFQQGRAEVERASLTQIEATLKKKQEERNKLEQEAKTSSQLKPALVPQIFDALRRRPLDLLRALAEHRTDNLIIEEIIPAGAETVVKGVVLQADEANRLRSALDSHLRPLAWQAAPPAKNDLGYFADGGPWRFEIKLKDLGLEGFVQPTAGTDPASQRRLP